MSSVYLSYWYFSQQSWFQLVLHPAQRFSWCTLHITYISRVTIYSLMYSFSYLEPVCCSMSSSNSCFLTCIQISPEAGQVVWYSHLFQNFLVYYDPHIQRLYIVSKAEIDVVLEPSCFFDDPVDVGNLISGFSAFSKSSLNIWKFTVHVLLKPGSENFEHYFTSVWVRSLQMVTAAMKLKDAYSLEEKLWPT